MWSARHCSIVRFRCIYAMSNVTRFVASQCRYLSTKTIYRTIYSLHVWENECPVYVAYLLENLTVKFILLQWGKCDNIQFINIPLHFGFCCHIHVVLFSFSSFYSFIFFLCVCSSKCTLSHTNACTQRHKQIELFSENSLIIDIDKHVVVWLCCVLNVTTFERFWGTSIVAVINVSNWDKKDPNFCYIDWIIGQNFVLIHFETFDGISSRFIVVFNLIFVFFYSISMNMTSAKCEKMEIFFNFENENSIETHEYLMFIEKMTRICEYVNKTRNRIAYHEMVKYSIVNYIWWFVRRAQK